MVLTGCSTVGPPEVTFYADGHAINAEPLENCDALMRACEQHEGAQVSLKVRTGKPVQISVPSDVAKTPWVVYVQYADAKGEVQIQQETFTPGERYAYTATPPASNDQLLVVEIQQVSGAYAADEYGNPILDEAGNPQLLARALWSLQIEPS